MYFDKIKNESFHILNNFRKSCNLFIFKLSFMVFFCFSSFSNKILEKQFKNSAKYFFHLLALKEKLKWFCENDRNCLFVVLIVQRWFLKFLSNRPSKIQGAKNIYCSKFKFSLENTYLIDCKLLRIHCRTFIYVFLINKVFLIDLVILEKL